MRAENAAQTIDDMKNGVTEVAELAKDIATKVGRKIDAAYDSTRRGVRQVKATAEEAVEDARHEIRSNPLTVVTYTAVGAFAVGMLAGWFAGRRRR